MILESTTYPGPPRIWWPEFSNRGRDSWPGRTSISATARSESTRGTSTGISPTRRKSSRASTPLPGGGQAFFDRLVDRTVPVSGTREAELTKLLENTFRHVNIALVNELAVFAEAMGIDVWEAIDAASTKPFGYLRFTPGPGVGGHCLPIDPSYLSWKVRRRLGQPFRFVELANDVNEHMPDYVVSRLTGALNRDKRSVNGSRVLLLGLSYKRNTGETGNPPAWSSPRVSRRSAPMSGWPNPTWHLAPRLASGGADCGRGGAGRHRGRGDGSRRVRLRDGPDRARYVLDTRNRIRGEGRVIVTTPHLR